MPDPLRLLRPDRLLRRTRRRPTLPARPLAPQRVATWDVVRTLPDGTAVRVRSIRPDDAETIRSGMERLSERSRYLRFHAPIQTLPEAHVRHLVDVDHVSHEALIVETIGDEPADGLGIARYVDDGQGAPEFAIVVVDEAQGRGIGRVLLRELFASARRAGHHELRAEVLAENTGMLRLLQDESDHLDVVAEGSILHVRVALAADRESAA